VLPPINSMSVVASTHDEPCNAAAAAPAITPRRPDHSHAPTVLSRNVGSHLVGMYTSRKIR
jgi:hypothetical protein